MKAWHFVGETLRDERPVPPDGTWLKHDGELVMCESGLHASKRLLDALHYAPGDTICRVEVDGTILHDDDKLVASKRKILWRIDGEQVLRAFARWCALQVVHLWDAPGVVIEYLTTGSEEIRSASWNAAWSAARAAAWSAARDAAWNAARAAAWSAARDAAWNAAWYAQNTQLELMVREARNGRTQTTLWEINLDKNVEGGHSTQKPLECMARPIRNHEFDVVYDPFLGSGTTLIACEQLSRRCRAVEISPAYVAVAIQRWVDVTGGEPELLP